MNTSGTDLHYISKQTYIHAACSFVSNSLSRLILLKVIFKRSLTSFLWKINKIKVKEIVFVLNLFFRIIIILLI